MTAPVERQKVRRLFPQARSHVDFIRVGGKMHQCARLKLEQGSARVTVGLVLPDRVSPALAGTWVLQFAGCHGQAIHREEQVHSIVFAGMTRHLAGHRELILAVKRQYFIVQAVGWLEVGEVEGLAVKLESVPQNMEAALEIKFFDQRVDKQGLQSSAVQCLHFSPQLGLGVLEEGEHARGKSARSTSHSATLPESHFAWSRRMIST